MLKTSRNKFIDKIKRMSIGNKITFLYAMVFAIVMITVSVVIMVNAWGYYRSVSKEELTNIVSEVEKYILSTDKIDYEAIDELNPNKNIKISVTTKGMPIMDKKREGMDEFPPPDFTEKPIHEDRNRFTTQIIKDQPYMMLEKICEKDGQTYFIQVFRPYRHETKVVKVFAVIFFVVNIIAIFIAYLIGKYISKKILQPISDMTTAAEQISAYDLDQRINVPLADDEIRTLALTFNDMIDRLRVSFEKQSRFISDASHELRTPISVIQGYANLIDRWGKTDSEVLEESIKSIKDETTHMTNLVNQLLFMAREETNAKNIVRENINLGNVANEVVKEVKILENINADIFFNGTKDVEIFADYHLIKQLIWILVENALKYSKKEGGVVTVNVDSDDKNVYLSVSDNGIGISEEDLPHIFDRFFRGDKSRNKEISGNGLGLCIAKWIIKEHNATVKVESIIGEGTAFTITFKLND